MSHNFISKTKIPAKIHEKEELQKQQKAELVLVDQAPGLRNQSEPICFYLKVISLVTKRYTSNDLNASWINMQYLLFCFSEQTGNPCKSFQPWPPQHATRGGVAIEEF